MYHVPLKLVCKRDLHKKSKGILEDSQCYKTRSSIVVHVNSVCNPNLPLLIQKLLRSCAPRKNVATDLTTIETTDGCLLDPVIANSTVPYDTTFVLNLEKRTSRLNAKSKALLDLNQILPTIKFP